MHSCGLKGHILQHFHQDIDGLTQRLGDILREYYTEPEAQPVFPKMSKADIVASIHQPKPPSSGLGIAGALDLFRERVLPASVKTWHPQFYNQMFAGSSPAGVFGDALASMLNPTLATWEMSPAATIIERDVAGWMGQLLGMPKGSSGIFVPGGSLANTLALAVARYRILGSEVNQKGLSGRRDKPVILCSDASHYSVSNAAMLMGIGTEQVIKVATNHRNEMLSEDLAAKLDQCEQDGLRPFAVVATLGITVTGGYDPLREIVAVCKGRNLHLHVDAAYGGGVALSKQGPALFDGIEHVDTVTWDAHKWMYVPLTCTALLAPNPDILKAAFATNANYLFHPQDVDMDLADDLGNYTLLCGKRFDGLRVWMMFQAMGETYFRELADDRMAFSQSVYEMLRDDDEFVPSYEPVGAIQCFRYLPGAVADAPVTYQDALHRHIRETLKRSGEMLFNISKLKGRDHFRAILINPLTTRDHFRAVMAAIRTTGEAYIAENPVPAFDQVG